MKRSVVLVALLAALPAVAGVTPQADGLIQPIAASPQVLVAAAGNVQGGNGTFFRSDITIINFADRDQIVDLRWLPQATSGNSGVQKTITIAARSAVSSEDFVANTLGTTGLGSIVVSGVTSNGALDTTALLFVTSRIWTPQPASTGNTSQTFDTIQARTGLPQTTAGIFGLRRDARYRANVGIVNMHAAFTETFAISVTAPSTGTPPISETYLVAVPPLTMQQVALNASTNPMSQVTVIKTTSGNGQWAAYGSSVDNVTGDAWSEIAIPGTP
jgi:hypothetical protein